jgi:preprotein translocase subunit YajC
MDPTTMLGLLADLPLVFAQEGASGSFWSTFMLILPIPFLFYFLIIVPQRQQEKKRRGMIESMKKNDKVLTSGGIYGTVISVDPRTTRSCCVLMTNAESSLPSRSPAWRACWSHLLTSRRNRPDARPQIDNRARHILTRSTHLAERPLF